VAIKCSAVRSAVWRNLGNVGLADTLVYVDLPLVTHHWFVTKRLIKVLFATRRAGRTTVRRGAARWTATRCCGFAVAC
jgi:hypothetical protein